MTDREPAKSGSVLQAIAELFPLTTLVIKLQIGCLFFILVLVALLAAAIVGYAAC